MGNGLSSRFQHEYTYLNPFKLDFKQDKYNVEWTAMYMSSLKPFLTLINVYLYIDIITYNMNETSLANFRLTNFCRYAFAILQTICLYILFYHKSQVVRDVKNQMVIKEEKNQLDGIFVAEQDKRLRCYRVFYVVAVLCFILTSLVNIQCKFEIVLDKDKYD